MPNTDTLTGCKIRYPYSFNAAIEAVLEVKRMTTCKAQKFDDTEVKRDGGNLLASLNLLRSCGAMVKWPSGSIQVVNVHGPFLPSHSPFLTKKKVGQRQAMQQAG